MKKRSIIPPLPEPFVLTEELEKDLKEWIQYLKNMSPRIVVKSIFDKDLKLRRIKNQFKLALDVSSQVKDIDIPEWPEDRQIAFIACFDSSFPGEKRRLLAKDGFIFCFNDFAFSLSDLEQDDESRSRCMFTYSFYNYGNPDGLTWKWQAETLQRILASHLESVPKLKTE